MTKKLSKPRVGIGYREEIHDEIMANREAFSCLEFISDLFFAESKWALLCELLNQFTLIPHGLDLSIASAHLRMNYIDKLKKLVEIVNPAYYSEHLALTNVPGITFNQLTSIFPNREQLQIVIDNVNFVQDVIQRPLVLENITQLIRFEGEMTIYDFVRRLVDRTSCGVLLDITNTYVDSFNYDFNPAHELEKWPLEAVYHVHLSGGRTIGDEKMDGHDAPVEETSWELFEKYLPRMENLQTVIIERDANYSNFSQIVEEVQRAKILIEKEISWINYAS